MGASLSQKTSGSAISNVLSSNPAGDKATNFMQASNNSGEQLDAKAYINKDGDLIETLNVHAAGEKIFSEGSDSYKLNLTSIETIQSHNHNDSFMFTTTHKDWNYAHTLLRNANGEVIADLKTSRLIYEIARFAVKLFTGYDMDSNLITKEMSKDYDTYLKAKSEIAKAGIDINVDNLMDGFAANRHIVEATMKENHTPLMIYNLTEASMCDSIARSMNRFNDKAESGMGHVSGFEIALNMRQLNGLNSSDNGAGAFVAGADKFTMHGINDLSNPEDMALFLNRVASNVNYGALTSGASDTLLELGAVAEKDSQGHLIVGKDVNMDLDSIKSSISLRMDMLAESNQLTLRAKDIDELNSIKSIDDNIMRSAEMIEKEDDVYDDILSSIFGK